MPSRTRWTTSSTCPNARGVDDAAVRQVVYDAYTATGAFASDDTLFELWLERALHVRYGPRPSWPPMYTKWSGVAYEVRTREIGGHA
jgi:hypothetical protein